MNVADAKQPWRRSPERERQIQTLLIGIVAFNLIPHAFDAPAWIVVIASGFLAWKALHLKRGVRLPSRLFANALAALAAFGTLARYGTIFGVEPASALLLLLASLKTLDTNGDRDAMLVILTSYFLLMAHLLASQSLASTAFMAVDVLLITMLMYQVNKRDRRSSARSFRPVMKLLAWALPLWAFIFFAFPRFGAGLFPSAERRGPNVGFSDDLSPGGIERLVAGDEPAFRATFLPGQSAKRPALDEMYWRGAVLSESHGLAWKKGPSRPGLALRTDAVDGPLAYEVILEPGYQRHLFTLEPARTIEFDDPIRRGQARRSMDGVFYLNRDSDGRVLYRGSAGGADPERADPGDLSPWLALPPKISPRTRALARELAAGAASDQEKAERVLDWFAREKFRYTLSPGEMRGGLDEFLFFAKRGFCEHYAGAFATLMRAMDVPARVVVGFLGGKRNEFGSYILVRGLDAHAWAEIYRRDVGRWERVDPVQSVAPMRLLLGGDYNSAEPSWIESKLSLDQIRARLSWFSRSAQTAGMAWDAATMSWESFLLRFDFDYQVQLLARLGVEGASRLLFWLSLLGGMASFAALAYAIMRWQARREDPLLLAWRAFCARAERAGVARGPTQGPLAFAARLRDAGPEFGGAAALAEEFAELRYGRAAFDRRARARFARAARTWRARAL